MLDENDNEIILPGVKLVQSIRAARNEFLSGGSKFMWNTMKTTLLMAGLIGLFMVFGRILGGQTGMIVAFVFAAGMNFVMYWFSDSIVLSQYGAEETTSEDYPTLHRVVGRLAEKEGMPKPGIYIISSDNPNAFATGRSPSHAAVAVTTGLLQILNENELEGVLAHELSHVLNRDTLISTIAATFAGAIAMLASIARFGALFGLGGRGRDNNIFVILATAIIAPIAASLIQMAVSRSREFKADKSGARLSGKPMELASALRKLERASRSRPMQQATEQTAHLFIVNPISADQLKSLFSTHPSVEDRVERLEQIAKDIR